MKKIVRTHLTERTVTFLHPKTGEMLSQDMVKSHLPVSKTTGLCDLTEALDRCTTDKLMLIGAHKDTDKTWFDVTEAKGYLKTGTFKHRSYSFTKDDKKIELRHIEIWFDEIHDIEKAAKGYLILSKFFKKHTGMPLLTSPSQTGLYDIERCLPVNMVIPELEPDIEQIVLKNVPQPRKEVIPHDLIDIDAFYYLDGIWMYAACIQRDLPVGPCTRDKINEYEKYRPGLYHLTFTIPNEWEHVGLIPVHDDKMDTWIWPNKAGSSYTVWVWEPELRLADENGWKYIIHERILFQKLRPFVNWYHSMMKLWDLAEKEIGIEWVIKLVRKGIRKIMLTAIGRMKSNEWQREKQVSVKEWSKVQNEIPKASRLQATFTSDGKGVSYPINERLADKDKVYYLPHITGHIWSYCRYLVGKTMLQIPYEYIIGSNLDAIYTTKKVELFNNGKPGCFRLKGCLHGTFKAPKSDRDFQRLTELRELSEQNFIDCKECNNNG